MRILVTGSSGHLGEALVRVLSAHGHELVGIDLQSSEWTDHLGSITDHALVRRCLEGVEVVLHTATLHKPHVGTHSKQEFVDTNISGTLNLLEAAVAARVRAFIFTSTTSAFGAALTPPAGEPAAWIDETVASIPKNIYGVTKTAAEDLCHLIHRREGLPCLILRTSRFFPDKDDNKTTRLAYADENTKANEFLYRRVDLEDVVTAHIAAMNRAETIGFGKYIISATTPFRPHDVADLRADLSALTQRLVPDLRSTYAAKGYKMFDSIDRVYVNAKARRELAWEPQYDFSRVLAQLEAGDPIGSELARTVGIKPYHRERFVDGLYPV